jgi:hypothetical protein
MVESDRKHERHHKKYHQNVFIVRTKDEQTEEADQQDYQLRRDHVGEDCAYEKSILTLKKRQALRAVMTNVKQVSEDLRLATRRTTQSQTPT